MARGRIIDSRGLVFTDIIRHDPNALMIIWTESKPFWAAVPKRRMTYTTPKKIPVYLNISSLPPEYKPPGTSFLDASSHLYKRICPSVGSSIRSPVRR